MSEDLSCCHNCLMTMKLFYKISPCKFATNSSIIKQVIGEKKSILPLGDLLLQVSYKLLSKCNGYYHEMTINIKEYFKFICSIYIYIYIWLGTVIQIYITLLYIVC